MENELTTGKNFSQRNRKWIVVVSILVIIAIGVTVVVMSSGMGNFARAYSDMPLYEEAVNKANANKDVTAAVGNIKPIDRMTIAEGNVQYNADFIASTITVKGTKGKAKMDIAAHKENGIWKYDSIKIRVKEPAQEILVMSGQ